MMSIRSFPRRLSATTGLRGIAACLFLSVSALAQQLPYDISPPAEPPYFRIRYDASQIDGELSFPVQYTIWIPPNAAVLRGVVVHQHGCGEGSCKSGLTGAYDLHWQALAAKHDCALLAPAYEQPEKADCQRWCDPRNGSDQAFQRGLADLGDASGHPELAHVAWALWGHSGGGHWAGGMVMLHPDRIVAAWLRSGVPLLEANAARPSIRTHVLPQGALQVPIMCNLGVNEGVAKPHGQFAGVWPANQTFFRELRSRGGLIGVAIDPLTSHECGNQRYLAIPWLDACLTARLPNAPGESLRPMPTTDVWLTPQLTGNEAVPASEFPGDPLTAGWLPDATIALAWMQYVSDTNVQDATAPAAPHDVFLERNVLRWRCTADLQSGLSHFVIERDGQILACSRARKESLWTARVSESAIQRYANAAAYGNELRGRQRHRGSRTPLCYSSGQHGRTCFAGHTSRIAVEAQGT